MSAHENTFIAHVRETDGAIQTLETHLSETAFLASSFSDVLGLPLCGRLIGLLHDVGKYSSAFQKYIRDITGLNGKDAKNDAQTLTGKIDHATSGAQIIWEYGIEGKIPSVLAQILSVVIMSHHSRSGMADFIDLKGESPFLNRLGKADEKTFKSEVIEKAPQAIVEEIHNILKSAELKAEFENTFRSINSETSELIPRQNHFALLTRFLYSCLLDADRISTADFENSRSASFRSTGKSADWSILLNRFEAHIAGFSRNSEINRIRAQISNECKAAANRPNRLFTLQVPTGAGKTLSSLRFALHRANSGAAHRVDRIIYILPYTSILDQNAEEVRKILGDEAVLEHHSNLTEERDTWRNRVLSENWDAPIVFTTSVQFLNSLFDAGTKTARRMHSLSNAILIFDEIQALPIKTIHLFNNALNFLSKQAHTSAVLCTATLPILHNVDRKLGALPITDKSSIVQDKVSLFKALKRTEIIEECRNREWTFVEIADHACKLQNQHETVLIICNTKNSAVCIFDLLNKQTQIPIIHLSTNMCPAHRRQKIGEMREKLAPDNPKPLICVSTQLVEAGVDLDFGCVIRSLAGLDSIVQAAGRCNRHGHREIGPVHILKFKEETLYASLKEIEMAQEISKSRIFSEFADDPNLFDNDLLSDKAMDQFYTYYFHQRAGKMLYPLKAGKGHPPLAQDCKLLSLLSCNSESTEEAKRIKNFALSSLKFRHAHSTAAQAFQVIDAPTHGILVPYDDYGHKGSKVIADLAASYTTEKVNLADQIRLHKEAQQYTVNVFPHLIQKLVEAKAIRELQSGEGIYYLDDRHYHKDMGVTIEALSEQKYLEVG